MDFKVLVNIIYKLMELELRGESKLPGASYILAMALQFPSTSSIVAKVDPMEILRAVYTVFFMFKGDDYEAAKFKSSELYLVGITELGDREYNKTECVYCDGTGDTECTECDGEGEVECSYCEGEGQLEGLDGPEECEYCDGRGTDTCPTCYGDGKEDCDECDGEGQVESNDEIIEERHSNWVFTDESLYEKLETIAYNTEYMSEDDLLNILDETETKGSVILLSTMHNSSTENYEDLQNQFDYNIDTGDAYISTIRPLSTSECIKHYPGGSNTSLVYMCQ